MKTIEIADFLDQLDCTDAVDALAYLVRSLPSSETALSIVEWMSSQEEYDPEASWDALADELLDGRTTGLTPTEVATSWVADKDLDRYADIVRDFSRGQKALSYAERALIRLSRYSGYEEWTDCIEVAGYDQRATNVADPNCRNTVAVYVDGSRLEYVESEQRWEVK